MTGKTIQDLPAEVLVEIFKLLSFKDVVENCSNTCLKWRSVVVHFFLQPYLQKLAKHHLDLRLSFIEEGWTEDCHDTELIVSLCNKHLSFKGNVKQLNSEPFIKLHTYSAYAYNVQVIQAQTSAFEKSIYYYASVP